MTEQRLERRVASGAAWTYAGLLSKRLIVFGGLVILARLLTPHDFGLFAMAVVAVNILEVARDLGLRRALIYFGRSEDPEAAFDTGLLLALGVGALQCAVILALAPFAGGFFGHPEVTSLMLVLSIYFLIGALGVVPEAILMHRLEFRRTFWPEVGGTTARYTVAVLLALNGFGAWSLVGGQLAGVSLKVVLDAVFARWWPRIRFHRAIARKLVGYASQISLVQLISAVVLHADYLLIGRFLGSAALGLYTVAFKLPDTTVGAMGTVATRVLLPAYVRLNHDAAQLQVGFLNGLRYLSLMLTPVAVGVCVLAPLLVPLALGEQWRAAIPVAQILALWALVNGLLQTVGSALLAAGQPRAIMYAQLIWAAVVLPGLYVASQVDIVLVAGVHVFGMLVFAAAKLFLISRFMHLGARDVLHPLWPSWLAASLMGVALVGLLEFLAALPPLPSMVVAAVVGAALYGAMIWLFDASAVRHVRALAVPMLGRS